MAKWNGQGDPPSHEAAIAWLIDNGVPRDVAKKIPPPSSTYGGKGKAKVGDYYRKQRSTYRSLSPAGRDRWVENLGKPREERTKAPTSSTQTEAAPKTALEEFLGLDIGGGSDRGDPLLPYSGAIPEDLTFENQSRRDPGWGRSRLLGKGPERIGPRYFEADTLEPVKWSLERRAQLQREMHALGLYGDKRIKLGSWSAADQAVYAELLSAANVEGRNWWEQLREWKRNPPQGLLDQIRGEGGEQRPTIRVSNPADIRTAARRVSAQGIGYADVDFAERAVGDFQEREKAAQGQVISDQQSGGGGVATDAPSMESYLEERLMSEKPTETTAYRMLGHFNSLLQRLGLAG